MALNVRFKSRADVILRQVASASRSAIQAAGEMAVESVQEKMLYGYQDPHGPDNHTEIVDTGALFDSLKSGMTKTSGNSYTVEVGSDLRYARYVHDGTWKLKGRPFIRDGLMDSQNEIEELLASTIRQGTQ